MSEALALPRNEHYLGDCKEVLRSLSDNSVDSVLTDPPYNLTSIVKRFGKEGAAPAQGDVYARSSGGFMGQQWDASGIAFDPELWAEVLRVLKPGGYLLAFGGTRTYHRMTCAIEDAGFEVRDSLMWVYGSGFPKSHDIGKALDKLAGAEREVLGQYIAPDGKARGVDLGIRGGKFGAHQANYIPEKLLTAPATDAAKQWDGWGTALKPAYEPIVVARKFLAESSIARNVLEWGTGAMNIDACRIDRDVDDVPGWHKTGADGTGGYMGESTFRTRQMSAEEIQARCDGGRWPANLLLQHTDDCTPQTCVEECAATNLGENARYFQQFWPENPLLYYPKPTAAERDYGCDGLPVVTQNRVNPGGIEDDPKWAPKAVRNNHPTLKPIALGRYLARLITPPGGTLLDLFEGSGSFGCAALSEGFHYLGIEREEPFWNIAKHRTEHARKEYEQRLRAKLNAPQLSLF
jgi:DNA modification methylase